MPGRARRDAADLLSQLHWRARYFDSQRMEAGHLAVAGGQSVRHCPANRIAQ
jgi:hypothetical protein